jgi:hypothetical protein
MGDSGQRIGRSLVIHKAIAAAPSFAWKLFFSSLKVSQRRAKARRLRRASPTPCSAPPDRVSVNRSRHCERSEAIQRSWRLLIYAMTYAKAIPVVDTLILENLYRPAIASISGLLRSARNDGGA